MIVFEKVSFNYGDKGFEIKDLSVEIGRGEFIGVIG
nr:ABC transporter ATP-binding protein [Thermofilum sp.]